MLAKKRSIGLGFEDINTLSRMQRFITMSLKSSDFCIKFNRPQGWCIHPIVQWCLIGVRFYKDSDHFMHMHELKDTLAHLSQCHSVPYVITMKIHWQGGTCCKYWSTSAAVSSVGLDVLEVYNRRLLWGTFPPLPPPAGLIDKFGGWNRGRWWKRFWSETVSIFEP